MKSLQASPVPSSRSLSRQEIVGAICGLFTLTYFLGQIVAQIASKAPYSIMKNTISELGITTCGQFENPLTHIALPVCSPLHAIMNASFTLYGLSVVSMVLLTRRLLPKSRLSSFGMGFLLLAGLCLIGTGFTPANERPLLHVALAAPQILLQNIALVLLGLAFLRRQRYLAWLTLAAGVVGVVGVIFSGTPPYPGLGYGGWQRVSTYPLALWVIGWAIALLVYQSRSRMGMRAASSVMHDVQ